MKWSCLLCGCLKHMMSPPGVDTLLCCRCALSGCALPVPCPPVRAVVRACCRLCCCCRHLVTEARAQCGPVDIIDRCNLTVLCEPGQEDTAAFLAHNKVRRFLAECDVLSSEVAMRPAAERTGSFYL